MKIRKIPDFHPITHSSVDLQLKKTYIILFQLKCSIMTLMTSSALSIAKTQENIEDWPCLFAKPCTCDYVGKSVDCTNNGLSEIPAFINYIGGNWYMDFSNNNLTSLPVAAFQNISLWTLKLSNNLLTSIADGALKGSEDTLSSLYLDNNLFTHIPTEIGKLKLFDIHLENNPILAFSPEVLSNISRRLNEISFGSRELIVWPSAIERLANLSTVTIVGSAFETIPDDAFNSLPNIFELTIKSTNLKSLPISLQKDTRLFILELDDNQNLAADGLRPEGFRNLKKLRQFYISNGNMDSLPPIFNDMSVLALFRISNTPIKHIGDDVFPKNFSQIFNEFDCDNCSFLNIPLSLSKTETLSTISLTNNNISYINDTDFIDAKKLFRLQLSGNPLESVSDNAFMHTPSLLTIDLDHTEMATIPKALQNAPNIGSVDLSDSKVVCTCSNLEWIRYWTKAKTIEFYGSCYNIRMTIADYVKNEVPQCRSSHSD